jgi:hypothetical protein
VVAGKSTNNVVESSKSPVIMGFFHVPKTSEYTLDTLFESKFAIFLQELKIEFFLYL